MQSAREEEPDTGADTRPSPDGVPAGMVIAGEWAWRLLAVAGVIALFLLLVSELQVIVIPLMVAILISALLVPGAAYLRRRGWPKWLAIIVTLVVVIGVLTGLGFLIVDEIADGLPSLVRRTIEAYHDARGFLMGGPFHFTHEQLHDFYRDVLKAIQSDTDALLARAVSVGSTLGRFVTGLFIAIVATVILLVDGAAVWRFVVRLFPDALARPSTGPAARAGSP
ncbi:hypothetical protein GCM10025867_18820 [Frondihabitans sucicola]|uniref:AI-2E family transporter n=1 Tax=Frondihabitans sucicola TaxID=1268041 RepID=A0ABM8GMM9_9MICO|nr:hypothetical protein GCM10025867_18820 [Frondihabitans sucicola]